MPIETRCIFCNARIGEKVTCGDGGRSCHFCRVPEVRAADPCIPGQDHHFVRGHEFQRVPIA
jgi:hypothetical protein